MPFKRGACTGQPGCGGRTGGACQPTESHVPGLLPCVHYQRALLANPKTRPRAPSHRRWPSNASHWAPAAGGARQSSLTLAAAPPPGVKLPATGDGCRVLPAGRNLHRAEAGHLHGDKQKGWQCKVQG